MHWGTGLKNIRWEDQTFPLGRISLGLLHRSVFNFIPKFTYFALAWIINFLDILIFTSSGRLNTWLCSILIPGGGGHMSKF